MVLWVRIPGSWFWSNGMFSFSKVSMVHNLSLLVYTHFPLCGLVLASGLQPGDFSLRSRSYCPAHPWALNFAVYLFASEIKATLICFSSYDFIPSLSSLPRREYTSGGTWATRFPPVLLVLIFCYVFFLPLFLALSLMHRFKFHRFLKKWLFDYLNLRFLPGERTRLGEVEFSLLWFR